MSSSEVPYILVSQLLVPAEASNWRSRLPDWHPEFHERPPVKVFVCINLIDHRCVGVGLSRDESIGRMRDITDEYHQE